jgi:heat-inducible transcriptional repressor
MADLEALGFVASPHTSAGRIPTDKGYRFFVDTLLKLKPLHHEEIEDIERRLGGDAPNGRSLVQTVSQMLSSVTHMAGLVTLPNPNYVALSQIEFIVAVGESRARHHGHGQPRGAEPGGAARPYYSPRSCGAPPIT